MQDDDHRKGGATAGDDPSLGKLLLADVRNRYRRNPRRIGGIAVGSALVVAVGVVAFLVFGLGGEGGRSTETAAAGPTPAAAAPAPPPPNQGLPIDSVHPEPEKPLPPDNPAVPNDAQGVDPQALLDHMVQERKIPLTEPDDRAQLQRIADDAVAREQPDFSADDQQITDAVAATFGSLNSQQKSDTVRCVAEFAERVYAQKHGTIPPDEADGKPGFGR